MKNIHLKVFAFSLVVPVALVILKSPGYGQRSRNQINTPPEKTVEQVETNIKVLNGMPQSQLYPTMRFMATSLGTQCGFCHVINKNGFLESARDDKPEKQTARQMIKLVLEINKTLSPSNAAVSCYTCHRGSTSPQRSLPLPLPPSRSQPEPTGEIDSSNPANKSASDLPMPSDILAGHLTAVGGKAAIDRIKSLSVKGTSAISNGPPLPYESAQTAPDKGRELFVTTSGPNERVVNGATGWLKNADGVQELAGQQLADAKVSFPMFLIFLPMQNQYSTLRVAGYAKIDERNMYVVHAIRPDNRSERLYFDAQTGLLRRRITYLQTMIGFIPEQIDFQDYRPVDDVKLPFTITMYLVDARNPIIIRKFSEIKINTQLNESIFDKPAR